MHFSSITLLCLLWAHKRQYVLKNSKQHKIVCYKKQHLTCKCYIPWLWALRPWETASLSKPQFLSCDNGISTFLRRSQISRHMTHRWPSDQARSSHLIWITIDLRSWGRNRVLMLFYNFLRVHNLGGIQDTHTKGNNRR